jgi:hypothetical protein
MNQGFSPLYFLRLLVEGLPFDQFSENEFWKFVCNSSQFLSIFEGEEEINLPEIAPIEIHLFQEFAHDHDWASDFLKLTETRKESVDFEEFSWPEHFKTVNGSKPVEVFSEGVFVFLWLLTAYQSGDFLGFRFEEPEKDVHPISAPKEKGRITFSKRSRRRKKDPISPEEAKRRRQEYQRQYYLAHREKAKEYQRQYNLLHKKKQRFPGAKGNNALEFKRESEKTTYNTHDIMHSPAEKTLKILQKILSGEKGFTI